MRRHVLLLQIIIPVAIVIAMHYPLSNVVRYSIVSA